MSKKNDLFELLSYIFAAILIFVSGLSLLFTSELTTLKCKRLQLNQKVTCEVTYFSLLRKRTIVIPTRVLQGAETRRKRTRSSYKYKVVLLTEIDEISIYGLHSYPSKIVASIKVKQINNFINNPEKMSLEMLQHPNWFIVFLGIILIFISVLLLLLALLVFFNFIARKFGIKRKRKSSIKRIRREISYPYHQDDKSDF
ncbi:MAG: hypothetical protein F6K40_38315 [Okeania sp. SIO3I5]|uniref:hypothetical protein n=1 Tax=Okeania sp. SIO3I5 TaxID=2607805 RepID=UPI0013BB4F48|nr:hypothetical protein [Okeania sp. SIO3I5]NEQ41727.1 hypothetical protein [Okeania sp. SIO3I5]